ncbi:MAG: cysteine--tRNA ligase [candidate division SR1 bacterium]|nr:cysteine--tRNA ligase [candidate division SR1 bacterium]
MQLKIYNTLSRQKELFVPLMEDPKYHGPKKTTVGLYSCGPTVYRDPHIGNMRAYLCRDILCNTLEKIMGYPLRNVMNMTDVGHLTSDADEGEDKMEKGAKRDNMTVWELADKYIASFKRYLKLLNIDEYEIICRATEHIQEQITMIQQLEKKGYTYIIPDDGVYMDTSKIKDYGYLAKLDIAGLQQGARIENENKKNKTDFGLRKFSPVNEHRQMEWDSPWGKGFPGRHIECSAMATKYLGEQFDIHTGGVDHISVHHVNEIAQSECALGTHPRVKYWMHNQFLNLGGKKQSKSEGGLVTVDELIKKGFHPLDFRYLCMTAHYRSFLEFNEDLLQTAKNSRNNLIKKMQKLFDQHAKIIIDFDSMPYEQIKETITSKYVGDALEDIMNALMDDLNMPQVLAIINQSLNSLDKVEEVDMNDLFVALHWLEKNLLKIGLFDRIGQEVKEIKIPAKIQKLAEQRLEAKQAKDYARSDELRKEILELGREVKDTKEGYELMKM